MCQIGVEAVQSSPSAQCHSSTASQPASQPCTEHTSLSPFLSAFLSLSISLALRARGTYCPHVSFLCQPPVPLPTVHVCLVSLSCPSFCLPRCMSCLSTYSSSSPPPHLSAMLHLSDSMPTRVFHQYLRGRKHPSCSASLPYLHVRSASLWDITSASLCIGVDHLRFTVLFV